MKGRILGYNANEYRGLIAGQDGQRYDFVRIDWHGRGEPVAGMEVDFQTDGGKARDLYEAAAQQPAPPPPQYSPAYTPTYGGQPNPGYGQPPPPPYGQPQQPYPPYGQPRQFYPPPGNTPPLDMDFPQAVRICFEKYATFSGRARRAEYWWFYLFRLVVHFVTRILDAGVQEATKVSPFSLIASLALFIPTLAVWTRRMHDTDRSGFWVLGFCVALVVLGIGLLVGVGMATEEQSAAAVTTIAVSSIGLLGVLIWWIVLLCVKGTTGTNRYGPDPLYPTADVF
jgi:uncharacterized membrane protein YhaH (DUF805 family)